METIYNQQSKDQAEAISEVKHEGIHPLWIMAGLAVYLAALIGILLQLPL